MKVNKVCFGGLGLAMLILFSSCIEVNERIFPGKKGRGELTLEIGLTYFQLFADTVEWQEKVQKPLEELNEYLSDRRGISEVQTSISSEEGKISLSLKYSSIEELNVALTYVYLGDTVSIFPFFEQLDGQWIRNHPPNLGTKVTERWQEVLEKRMQPEDQAAMKFRYITKLKEAIGLVYAPFPTQIFEKDNEVHVELSSLNLFGSEEGQVKILTN
ncbi:MAG: hypothetical protein AAF694_10010 [Bacteroidota bacterium]